MGILNDVKIMLLKGDKGDAPEITETPIDNGHKVTFSYPDGDDVSFDLHNATSGDYSGLTNKPSINGVILNGNKTGKDLGVSEMPDYSYGSKDASKQITIQHPANDDELFKYADVQAKGLYRFKYTVAETMTQVRIDIGTTEYDFNSTNESKFYHFVTLTSTSPESEKSGEFMIPLDVGDRVGVACNKEALVTLLGIFIPIHGV